MLLKKIIDLISYEQLTSASNSAEDFISECSGKSLSDSIGNDSDGVQSRLSLTEGTSVQGFHATPLKNNLLNKGTCVTVPDEISDRKLQKCSPFEAIIGAECVLEAEAKASDDSSREEHVPAYDLSLPSDEKYPEFYSNTTSKSSCLREEFAQTELEVITSDIGHRKDSFSQTEAQVLDKQSQRPVVTYNNSANKNIIVPSDSIRHENRFGQTKAHIPAASNRIFAQTVAQEPDKQRQISVVTHKQFANESIMEPNRKYKSSAALNAKSKGSVFFPRTEKQHLDPVVYGTLFVFGCNGAVPTHLVGKMSSKYVLRKRVLGNGLKEAFCYIRHPKEPVSISPAKHVISYPVSSNTCIDVAFKPDPTKDMFQIGRHDELPIDFTVDDLNPSDASRHGVSRYACRILVRRDGSHEARIYAAAFDSSQTIFLGEESIPCTYRGKMDGFTTNGVLIMKPRGNQPGTWREVSVSGNIYPVRHFSKVEASKRPRMIDESNILEDGTLIDLCGLTLLWRTPDGLNNTPVEDYLFRLQSKWHKSVPESLLLSQTMIIKPKSAVKKAYVFLSCGHVVGLTLPKEPQNLQGWSCPVCRVISHIAEVKIGAEPGFYLDEDFPIFAFKPCGHVASKRTVEYWSCVKIPLHRSFKDSVCPFCGKKLNTIKKNVKLLFPVN